MAEELEKQAELIGWLEQQGHTPEQIEKIMAKVAEYDKKTMHESVFDSISDGSFDISKLIEEALGEGY